MMIPLTHAQRRKTASLYNHYGSAALAIILLSFSITIVYYSIKDMTFSKGREESTTSTTHDIPDPTTLQTLYTSSSSKRSLVSSSSSSSFLDNCPTNPQYTQHGMTILSKQPSDQSGWAIALSNNGQYLAIGAPYNNDISELNNGSVSIFKRSNTNPLGWEQVGNDIDGLVRGDGFGWSIAISDDGMIVAVGAVYSHVGGKWSGQVRVFERSESSKNGYYNIDNVWKQVGESINGKFEYDYSGASVALSGDGSILAIGADEASGNGENNGSVRVFIRRSNENDSTSTSSDSSSDTWLQLGQDINGKNVGDAIGGSLALSHNGKVLAIGSHLEEDGYDMIGHVRIFEQDPTTTLGWKQIGKDIDGTEGTKLSSKTVALSKMGDVIAIGSRQDHGDDKWSGKVRVYQVDPTSSLGWLQVGLDIDGESSFDYSGHSVSLSDDGTILAIGATHNDDNGKESGHVRMYRRDLESELGWSKIGDDLDGMSANSIAGWSVDLSGDGSTLAVGAPGVLPLNNNGYVQVYQLPCLSTSGLMNDLATGLEDSEEKSNTANYSPIIIASVFGCLALVAMAALYGRNKRKKSRNAVNYTARSFNLRAGASDFL